MSEEVVLYDLPSTGRSQCWSLNPWKTRAALNYKGIPYKTEWTEYPDLAPHFKSLGIQPNDEGVNPTPYSSPAVRLPDGRYVMDSRAIADELEKLQPLPSLHLDNGYTKKTQDLVLGIAAPLSPEFMPKVPAILPDRSAEYFERTRAVRFGMPLSEYAKCDKAGKVAWDGAEPHLKELVKLLQENDGPFIAGKDVSYADLILGGFIMFAKRIDTAAFDRLLEYDPVIKQEWEAVSKYFERGDH